MKIKTIIVDDNKLDLQELQEHLSNLPEIEIIGAYSRIPEIEEALFRDFYLVDLLITDLTLVATGDLDDKKNAPGILDQVRKKHGVKSLPFGLLYVTSFIDLWAVNFVLKYPHMETLLRFISKNRPDDENRDYLEQLEDGLIRFKEKFMEAKYYNPRLKTILEKWRYKDNYIEDYLSQKISISGAFEDGSESKHSIRRYDIIYLCRENGSCKIKINHYDKLFTTEETFKELNEYLWWPNQNESLSTQDFRSYIASQFIEITRGTYINIDFLVSVERRLPDGRGPKGGYAILSGEEKLEISEVKTRDLLDEYIKNRPKKGNIEYLEL